MLSVGVTFGRLATASALGPPNSLEDRPENGACRHGTHGFVVMQFDSPPGDAPGNDFATSLAQKQAENIKAGLH